MKYSKLVNGTSSQLSNSTYHATPFEEKQKTSRYIPPISFASPSIIRSEVTTKSIKDFSNTDTSTISNENLKKYSIHTGLSEDQPIIILTSKFIPIFSFGKENFISNALNTKENSILLTAKNAINILSQNKDTQDYVSANTENLKTFLDSENEFIKNILSQLSDVLCRLNVKNWSYKDTSSSTIYSFETSLLEKTYKKEDIDNFSNSKLWNQFLLEFKLDVISHTRDLIGTKRDKSGNDKDPYKLSGLVAEKGDSSKRIWINPYYKNILSEDDINRSDDVSIDENVKALISLQNNLYVNLNSALKTGNQNSTGTSSSESIELLTQYHGSGKDISLISNSLAKEANYSKEIISNSKILSDNYGYSISIDGSGNIQIWDYLVGKFKNSVLEVQDSSSDIVGKGRSLSSLSQYSVLSHNSSDQYKVLTFESSFLPQSEITPGSFYFIDSTLDTPDGKNFDLSRINVLTDKLKKTSDTLNIISKFCGYDQGQKDVTDPADLVNQILHKFDYFTDMYSKCILPTNLVGNIPTGLAYDVISNLSNQEKNNRFSAAVARCAIIPSDTYKYQGANLKSLLFLMVMNAVILQAKSESSSESSKMSFSDESIKKVQNKIMKILKDGSIELDDYIKAKNQNRIFADHIVITDNSGSTITDVSAPSTEIISLEKGIWKTVFDIMKEVYNSSDLYDLQNKSSTVYSGINKIAYLFAYFDMILRVISSMSPEILLGKYGYHNKTAYETGLVLKEVLSTEINSFFYMGSQGAGNGSFSLGKNPVQVQPIEFAKSYLITEKSIINSQIGILKNFVSQLNTSLIDFSVFLGQKFGEHIANVSPLYESDTELNSIQKNALLGMSLTEEQLVLSNYISSELSDKINTNLDSESKLSSIPFFADFPKVFSSYLPINDTELLSYFLLSSFFKSEEFLLEKGNNKKIMSIGIPPKMLRSLSSTSSSPDTQEAIRKNIIRIKIYKVDRLHPELVFIPQSYLFEMSRFPTRVLGNWNFNNFSSNETNILQIPTKFYLNSQFNLHDDYSKAFESHGSILSDDQKVEIYSNHAKSYLAEEYLRWFTDCNLDETRYFHYSKMSNTLHSIEVQYQNYLNTISSNIQQNQTAAPANSSTVSVQFTDPLSGNKYTFPSKMSNNMKPDNIVSSQNKKIQSSTVNPTLDLTDSMRSYFLRETLMHDTSVHKRRASYPKKFDRCFSIIFDPDDFIVDDSQSDSSTLAVMKQNGIIIGGNFDSSNKKIAYRHRDTSPGDVSFDQYFTTVEPFDYNQTYGSGS